jgi:hypothetical protein
MFTRTSEPRKSEPRMREQALAEAFGQYDKTGKVHAEYLRYRYGGFL